MKVSDLPKNPKALTLVQADDGNADILTHVNPLFPLFSTLQRESDIPRGLNHLIFFFVVFQASILSTMPVSRSAFDLGDRILLNIFLLNDYTNTVTFYVVLGLMTLIGVAGLITTSMVIFYYRFAGIMIPNLYRTANYYTHFFAKVLVIPQGTMLGHLIYACVMQKKNIAHILFAVVFAIMYVYTLIIVITVYVLDANSVFLSNSSYMNFNGYHMASIFLLISVFGFFTWIIPIFGDTMRYIVGAVYALCSILITIPVFYFSFGSFITNVIIGAITSTDTISTIVSFFNFEIPTYVNIVIAFGLIIIISIILYFTLKAVAKRYLSLTEYKNIKQAIITLRVALIFDHESFANGTLIDFIASRACEPSDRLTLARFCCYFPDWHPIFFTQLSILVTEFELTTIERYLFYQLKQIELGRQQLTPFQEIIELKNEANNLRNTMQTNWKQIRTINTSCFTLMETIAEAVKRIDYQYKELLSRYPKNAIIPGDYARFMIECQYNFTKAIKSEHLSLQMKEGKTLHYDNASIHFLRAYPRYHPDVLKGSKVISSDELDFIAKQKIMNSMCVDSYMRIDIQNAMQNLKPKCLRLMQVLNILSLIFLLIFWIAIMIYAPGTFRERCMNMELIYNITKLHESIAMSILPLFFTYSSQVGLLQNQSELVRMYSNVIKNETSIFPIDVKYKTTASAYTLQSILYFSSIHEGIAQQIELKTYKDDVLKTLLENRVKLFFYKDDFVKLDAGNSSLNNLIIYFLTKFDEITQVRIDTLINTTVIYDLVYISVALIEHMNCFAQSCLSDDQSKFTDKIFELMIVTIVVCAAFFIMFCLSQIISFIIIQIEFTKVLELCKKFSDDAIMTATKPLTYDIPFQYTENASQIIAPQNSIVKLPVRHLSKWIFSIYILLFLFWLACLPYFYITCSNTFDVFKRVDGIFYNAAIRQCYSVRVINDLFGANVYNQMFPYINLNYNDVFEQSLNTFIQAHQIVSKTSLNNTKYDNLLTKARETKGCEYEWGSEEHDTMVCLPLDSGITTYIEKINKLKPLISVPGLVKSEKFLDLLHYETYHLYYLIEKIPNIIYDFSVYTSSNYDNIIFILGGVNLFVSFLIFGCGLYVQFIISENFKMLLGFIAHINPANLVENYELLRYLFGIDLKGSKRHSPISNMIMDSRIPVLFIDPTAKIDNINSAFKLVFGYDISHIVNHQIETIINDNLLKNRIDTMRIGTCTDTAVYQVIVKKENGVMIDCNATVIPVKNDDRKLINIAIVLEDLTALKGKNKKKEKLKVTNDKIEKQLFPVRNEGFLEHAAICIIKLTQWDITLPTVDQLMQRQKTFNGFEDSRKCYPSVVRVGIQNDSYTVIAFGEIDSSENALECLNFAISVSQLYYNGTLAGGFKIAIDSGKIYTCVTNGKAEKFVASGAPIKNIQNVIAASENSSICITHRVYHYVANQNLLFTKVKANGMKFYTVGQL